MKPREGSESKGRKRRRARNLTAKSRLQHQAVRSCDCSHRTMALWHPHCCPVSCLVTPARGPWKEANARRFSVQCVFLLPLSPCLEKLKFLPRNRRCNGYKNRRFCFIGELVVNHGHRCWKAPTVSATFLVAEATQI